MARPIRRRFRRTATMAADPQYPKRESHFAHKAIRMMIKTCVASEWGPQVFTLLTVIVHTEDAAHYRRPVTFYNPALIPLVGCDSETTFKRVRSRAVESGWLVYAKGARGKPAKYYVQIPPHATGLDDLPSDEGDETYQEIPEDCVPPVAPIDGLSVTSGPNSKEP